MAPAFTPTHSVVWQLEILDNRAGAANGAVLQSWQLEFEFANTNLAIAPGDTDQWRSQSPIRWRAGAIDWFPGQHAHERGHCDQHADLRDPAGQLFLEHQSAAHHQQSTQRAVGWGT